MGPRRRRVAWSEAARRDLDSSISFVAEDSHREAIHLLESLLDAAASLGDLSERGRIVPERLDPTIREILVQPFRLIYRVEPSEVLVLGVLHQRRDFERWNEHQENAL